MSSFVSIPAAACFLRAPTLLMRLLPLSAALAALAATPAGAQSDAPAPVLEAITVKGSAEPPSPVARRAGTATKTDTPLSETPQAVSVVTRQQLEEQAAVSLQDALLYAAGVRSSAYGLDSRGDWQRVRGTEPVQYQDGLQQLFGFNNNTRAEPYALERIELLRGPSSVLYGQGSTGGVVNLVSKRPQPERTGEIGLQFGSHRRRQVQADYTGPLSADGDWLYRVVALARRSDTQVDYVPDDRLMLAPSLTWRASAQTTLTLQAHWQRDDSGSTAIFAPWYGVVLPNVNGRVPANRFVSEPGFDEYDTERRSLGYLFEHRASERWTLRQNLRYTHSSGSYQTLYPSSNFADPRNPYLDGPDATLADSVPGELGRWIGRYAYVNQRETHTFVADQHAEGRLQWGAIEHRLLAGLDFQRYGEKALSGFATSTNLDLYAPTYGNYTAPVLSADNPLRQQQLGLYLQDQIKLGPRWLVMAGLRHDRASSSVATQDKEHDSATTKRAALMYLAGSGWSPYLSYSESFQPIAGKNFFGQRYRPLRGEQVEAGLKFAPEGADLAFNAAVYELREQNRQVSDPQQPLNQLQTGETDARGIELDVKARIARRLDLTAHYNYTALDEEIEDVPRHQAAVWGTWRFASAGVGGWSAGLGVRYLSAFIDGSAPETPSLTLADALLAYQTPAWRFALNVSNLADKDYPSTCLRRGDCFLGAGRNVLLTATYRH